MSIRTMGGQEHKSAITMLIIRIMLKISTMLIFIHHNAYYHCHTKDHPNHRYPISHLYSQFIKASTEHDPTMSKFFDKQ